MMSPGSFVAVLLAAALVAIASPPAPAQEAGGEDAQAQQAPVEPTPESLRAKYPPRVEEMRPTPGWAPQFLRPTSPAVRETTPLRVDWADNQLDAGPVTFGVPFPREAVASAENIRLLTANGEVVPCQVETTATWDGPDGAVRWALISANLRRGTDYSVEFGSDVARAATEGITVAETDEAIVINTGPMQATISKVRGTLFDEVALNGQTILTPDAAASEMPVVIDAAGNRYPAGGAADGLQVSIERSGPMEVAVRREGWYTGADGTRFCQFITHTYFYAGESAVRHDHTLVVAFDSKQHQIRNVQIALPLELGDAREAIFASDESPTGSPLRVAGADLPARLVQASHEHFTLTSGAGAQEGEQAGGWFGLTDGSTGAFAGWRDFWQQYPQELEADGNTLRLHLWPAHDTDVLNFQPSSWMGDMYPGDTVFHADFYRGGLDEWVQAYGVGKTHNVWISFFRDGQSERAAQLTRAFDEPVLALATPEWNCATEAFGRMAPYDAERYPDLEGALKTIVHRRQWLAEALARLGWMSNYGWINFGDINYNVANALDPEKAAPVHWRHWPSMFYGWPNVTTTLYMRSGERDYWHLARQNTRHIADIDICHLDSDEFDKWRGGRYGGNGAICHYGADQYDIGCDSHSRFMWQDYYINGTLRSREVAREFIDGLAARRNDSSSTNYVHRHTGGGLRLFCEAWEATWDPEYLSIMHQFADTMYQARERDGHLRYDDGYMNEGKIRYYQLTGEEKMLDLFLNDMNVLTQFRDGHYYSDSRASSMLGLSHAYWFTGDTKYLPFAAWQMDIVRHKIPAEQLDPIQGYSNTYDPTIANQLPVVMQAMNDAGGEPVPDGPPPSTSRAIYFNEPADQQFTLKVDLVVCAGIPGLRSSFASWREWFDSLPEGERPDLVLTAPDGSEAGRFDITSDLLGEPSSMAFRLAQQGRPTLHEPLGKVDMTIEPDGQSGTYTLAATNEIVPIRMTLMESSLPQRVLHTGDAWVYGSTEHFVVPAGTGQFAVEIKPMSAPADRIVAVRNGRGEEVTRFVYSREQAGQWHRIELDAGAPAADEAWCLYFLEPVAAFVRFDGVPGGVAASAREAFVPDSFVSAAEAPALDAAQGLHSVPSDLPWGGAALAMPVGEEVTIAAADGRPLLSREAGTIELWVKDLREPTQVNNRSYVTCGPLLLQRRMSMGTYFYISSSYTQTAYIPPRDRWIHVAATWRLLPDGTTDTALFVDGVPIETTMDGSRKLPEDWPGTELKIPEGLDDIMLGGLRVSNVVRYEGPYERPGPLSADEQTTILWPCDGSGTATVFGEQVEVK